jgi:hypothetical protein
MLRPTCLRARSPWTARARPSSSCSTRPKTRSRPTKLD